MPVLNFAYWISGLPSYVDKWLKCVSPFVSFI